MCSVWVGATVYAEVRGQVAGIHFLLSPCGFRD